LKFVILLLAIVLLRSYDIISIRRQSRNSDSAVSKVETPRNPSVICSNVNIHGQAASSTMHESDKYKSQHGTIVEPRNSCGFSRSSHWARNGTDAHEIGMECDKYGGDLLEWENTTNVNTVNFNCSPELTSSNESIKAKGGSHSLRTKISKLPKSTMQVSGEQCCSGIQRKGQISNQSSQSGNSLFTFYFSCTLHFILPLIMCSCCRSC
jgi:hypothetical protein